MGRKMKQRSPLKVPPLRVPGQSLDAEIQRVIDDATTFWTLLPLLLWVLPGYEWWSMIGERERQPAWLAAAALAMTVSGGLRIYCARAGCPKRISPGA
jgi:hypothetical protein